MNYIYIIIAILIIGLLLFFCLGKKKLQKNNNQKIQEKQEIREKQPIEQKREKALPIFAQDTKGNLVHVGDVDDLNRQDDRSIVSSNNIQEGEVYFNTQDHQLEYKGRIEDLKAKLNTKPPSSEYIYMLTNHTDPKTKINYFIIYIIPNKKED